MRSGAEIWNLENRGLKAFSETFVKDTHRMVADVAIDAEEDCVVVYGRTRSYYAVQLAIRCVQSFNRGNLPFPITRLSLEVNDHSLELRIVHPLDGAQVAEASPIEGAGFGTRVKACRLAVALHVD